MSRSEEQFVEYAHASQSVLVAAVAVGALHDRIKAGTFDADNERRCRIVLALHADLAMKARRLAAASPHVAEKGMALLAQIESEIK